jgi:hypothetical protein
MSSWNGHGGEVPQPVEGVQARANSQHVVDRTANANDEPRLPPEAHSLALRLKKTGIADEVVCGYLHIEPEGLETLLRVASEKLNTERREL